MRIALLDVKKATGLNSKFTAVNVRNLLLIKNELKCDLFLFEKDLLTKTKYDVIIFGFNSIHTETVLTQKFITNNPYARYFVLCGEYEQTDCINIRYVNRRFSVIQNYEGVTKMGLKHLQLKTHILNLNLLISKQPNNLVTKKYDCIYYGRWREDRSVYFKRYIQGGLYLSTSTKNMKKFKHEGCNPKYLDTISWTDKKETLNLFRYSLYIEDVYTHKVFNNLANRWYEAGFCNVVMFFDINCWNTILKSEIAEYEDEIKYYIVTDYNSLQNKITECNKDFAHHLNIQKGWRKNELQLRSKMIDDLKNIINHAI